MSLGCCINTASIVAKCEGKTIAVLDDITCLEYDRLLSGVSEANVTVGRQGQCCEDLGELARTWATELVIQRCGKTVWSGPVTRIRYTSQGTRLEARDRLAWMDRRLFRSNVRFEGSYTSIAQQMIESGLRGGPEDRCIRDNMTFASGNCGRHTSRKFDACQASIGSELRKLADGPFNFTTLGRAIVLWCNEPLGRTATLQDKDFLGEMEVIEDGYAAATAVCVKGEGVTAYCGGTDDYLGLLEQVISDESIDTTADARQLACSEAATFNPPPVYLSVPDGIRLAPDAPVTFDELVPGVEIPIWSNATCRQVNQSMVLIRVQVQQGCSDEGDGADERVLITVAPKSILGSPELETAGETIG